MEIGNLFSSSSSTASVGRVAIEIGPAPSSGGGGFGGIGSIGSAIDSILGGGGSASDPWKKYCVEIITRQSVAPGVGSAEIVIAQASDSPQVAIGDQLQIKIGQNSPAVVFSGSVVAIQSTINGYTRCRLNDNSMQLSKMRFNKSYSGVTCGDVVNDLCSIVNASAGTIDTGFDLPGYFIDDRKNGWNHISAIADLCGMWAYCDSEGNIQCTAINLTSPVATLNFGENLLAIDYSENQVSDDAFTAAGEGASSTKGKDNWNIPLNDNSALRSTCGSTNGRTRYYGAIRNTNASTSVSDAAAYRRDLESVRGKVKIPGNPAIVIGSTIEIKDAPQTSCNGKFLVCGVEHHYSKTGFTSSITYCKGVGSSGGGSFF